MSKLKIQDNFNVLQMQNLIKDLKKQIKQFKTQELQDQKYKEQLFENKDYLKQIQNTIDEFDQMKLNNEKSLETMYEIEQAKYSRVNEDLNWVSQSLMLFSELDSLQNYTAIDDNQYLELLKDNSLKIILDQTTSRVQKLTAFKIIERLIKTQAKNVDREVQTMDTKTDEDELRLLRVQFKNSDDNTRNLNSRIIKLEEELKVEQTALSVQKKLNQDKDKEIIYLKSELDQLTKMDWRVIKKELQEQVDWQRNQIFELKNKDDQTKEQHHKHSAENQKKIEALEANLTLVNKQNDEHVKTILELQNKMKEKVEDFNELQQNYDNLEMTKFELTDEIQQLKFRVQQKDKNIFELIKKTHQDEKKKFISENSQMSFTPKHSKESAGLNFKITEVLPLFNIDQSRKPTS